MRGKILAQNFSECQLGGTRGRAIIIGEIEMGDPGVKGRSAQLAFRAMLKVVAKIMPKPERHGREQHAAPAAAVVCMAALT